MGGMADLGGGSTQIAFVSPHLRLSAESTIVHSYSGLGLQALATRARVFAEDSRYKACWFGNSDSGAAVCRTQIAELVLPLMEEQHHAVTFPGPIVAVSLYYHAVHCAAVLLKEQGYHSLTDAWPSPSVPQLKIAADVFCAFELEDLKKKANGNPAADFKQSRCFELNYVIVLLAQLNPDNHQVQFVDELQGQSVDWPLGVYLDHLQRVDTELDDAKSLPSWIYLFGFTLFVSLLFAYMQRFSFII